MPGTLFTPGYAPKFISNCSFHAASFPAPATINTIGPFLQHIPVATGAPHILLLWQKNQTWKKKFNQHDFCGCLFPCLWFGPVHLAPTQSCLHSFQKKSQHKPEWREENPCVVFKSGSCVLLDFN